MPLSQRWKPSLNWTARFQRDNWPGSSTTTSSAATSFSLLGILGTHRIGKIIINLVKFDIFINKINGVNDLSGMNLLTVLNRFNDSVR